MAKLSGFFKPNAADAVSNEKAVYKGKYYRITVLSESLIRLEYDEGGVFEDRPTELAKFRNFPVPVFQAKENENILEIRTKYFTLQYQKEKPFHGSTLAPDAYLKVALNETDKAWYYSHEEPRRFDAYVNNLDTREPYMTQAEKMLAKKESKKIFKKKTTFRGLYSTDGFVSIDDSKSLLIDEEGYLFKDERPRIDIYLFMYKRDFGVCLRYCRFN